MVEIVAITKGMIDEATELMQNYGNCKNADTVAKDNNKAGFYGQLGEVVFSEYLLGKGIAHLTQKGYQKDRPTDDYDFMIGKTTIDVKTIIGLPHDKNLLIKRSLFDRGKTSDWYVAISIDEKLHFAFICGCISKENVEKLPFKKFVLVNYYKPLDDLFSVGHMLEMIKIKGDLK